MGKFAEQDKPAPLRCAMLLAARQRPWPDRICLNYTATFARICKAVNIAYGAGSSCKTKYERGDYESRLWNLYGVGDGGADHSLGNVFQWGRTSPAKCRAMHDRGARLYRVG